ncbi:hypothetical protein [Streptosporangium sp. NPDC001681]|uniref:hypothetical protein n=1 Tax=Streptosporangium sp. NPDC001681 TaxID=3154395 RepID=UPI00332D3474
MPAADVTPWLRPDAPTSPQRLFCHTYGRRRSDHQMIPGRPYSVIADAVALPARACSPSYSGGV